MRRVLLCDLAAEDHELHQRGRESVYSGRQRCSDVPCTQEA